MSFKEAVKMVKTGKIKDSKTIVALLYFKIFSKYNNATIVFESFILPVFTILTASLKLIISLEKTLGVLSYCRFFK
ncbi:MAG: hypothetical protein LE169_01100 [Endomicrobium sp.]|nr:hypothetical protein [Endomicrobium sp.]